ncbi:MAG: NlpC/P60 family protein [Flaviaesturariibacter sp.]|nr:NlpC/P60 family protein [Flaviaesturariibacter sp.]
MNYAINLLSVIPMRKEGAHRSEMVSQLLFGEYVEVLEGGDDFMRVKCLYDGYEGWVQTSQLTPVDEVLPTDLFVGHWSDRLLVNDQYVPVPLGTPLYISEGTIVAGRHKISHSLPPSALWHSRIETFRAESFLKVYSLYLNTPYLWGGKSVFGIDCSGFVQQVFKLFGIRLLRDGYLQAEQGTPMDNLLEARMGDLAFFNNEAGKITHVGILLSPDQIVHAAGKVRIDRIDAEGIMNVDTGKRTHTLHSIRRIID